MRSLSSVGIALALAAGAPTTLPAQLSPRPIAPPTPAVPPPVLPGDAALRARYAVPGSRFMEIDGQAIHYVDEGSGPAIVLVHGSYSSLRQWSGWARGLSRRYRVIRFDRPPGGLSGPNPTGIYDAAREQHLIDALTTRLGVDRFVLVATSSGAISAAAYAADHPARIIGVVLNNIGLAGMATVPADLPPAFRRAIAADAPRKGYHTAEFWRQVLLFSFHDKAKVTPALVREWTDLDNRAPLMPQAPGQIGLRESMQHAEEDLARITAPTLLIWSADDTDTRLDQFGDRALRALGTSDKRLAVVPRCGHMMPIECGAAGLAVAMPFLDRVTTAYQARITR